ncbi:MAG: hypothetical protein K8M05_36575, partial [Deltaproteobacteria bacterium]|nr:hypothetical protein [Kofleriaceae bacterium]
MTRFDPPGAGAWRRDEAHVDGVLTGYLDAVLTPAQQTGFAEGFAEVGAMLAGFDVARVAGHVYMRPIIAGAPRLPIWGDTPPAVIKPPGKAPPRFVFKLLFLLHPELRRRAKRAAEVWERKLWREVARRWEEELRPAAARACLALTRTNVMSLDDAALAQHLEEATRQLRERTLLHFRHAPLQAVVVGDFLVRARAWTGASASDVLGALRGASPA